MSLTAVTLNVTDNTIPTGLALEEVLVRVYSSDGTVFVTEGETDEDGSLSLDLEDATTYWVRFFKVGYRFASKLRIEVDSGQGNTFTVEGVDLTTYPPATDPNLCRVSGSVLNAGGSPAPGVTFEFMLTGKPRVVGGRVMVASKVIARSDSDGDLDVDLVRNGVYDVIVEGHDDEVFRVKVPDYAYADVTDLIWPYVASLTFSEDSLALSVGDTGTVTAVLTLSSRTVVPYDLDNDESVKISDFATITSDDETVATISIDEDGVITVTAVAAGTATISAELVDGATAECEPTPTTTLSSVTVTVT